MSLRRLALCLASLLLLLGGRQSAAACEGRFLNPITDICWTCIFPLRLGSLELAGAGQLDAHERDSWLCNCSTLGDTRIGVWVEFWEPVRLVEVTRTPFCLVSLGGLQVASIPAAREPGARTGSAGTEGASSFAFYQAHWYVNPVLHWLGVLLDFDCLERAGYDLAYMSELDPSWSDDQLAGILNPEGLLTASLAGVAACAADCAATVSGWPSDTLWWCAGCTGMLFPSTGNVAAHVSGRQSSALLAARLTARMHRTGATLYTHGTREGACGPGRTWRALIKDAYKMSMVYPRAQAERNRRCCEPFGASPELWAAGSEWPITGEDFTYMLFRKRHCCAGGIGI